MFYSVNRKDGKPLTVFTREGRNPCRFKETHIKSGEFAIHTSDMAQYRGMNLLQACRDIEKICAVKLTKRI